MRVWIVCLICVALCSEEFTPWWTGSLLSNPGHTVPKGKNETFNPTCLSLMILGCMTANGAPIAGHQSKKLTSNTSTREALTTGWMGKVIPQMFINWNSDHHAIRLGDLPVIFGFQLLEQQKGNVGALTFRVTLSETFPTGNYQRLNPGKKGVDISGTGSFETGIGINIQKKHPLVGKNHYFALPL